MKMNYREMMKDCILYMNQHLDEKFNAESLGKFYSYNGESISWMFQCYYKENLSSYLGRRVKLQKLIEGGDQNQFIQSTALIPAERPLLRNQIRTYESYIGPFNVVAKAVIHNSEDLYSSIDVMVRNYQMNFRKDETSIALWWHDDDYNSRYMQGKAGEWNADMPEDMEKIVISGSRYMVFSMKQSSDGENLAEEMKNLIHYVHLVWIPRHEESVDLQGYSFEGIKDGKAYYCLALLDREKEESAETVYGIDTWTEYINANILSNLTTASLAQKFHYSETHFKRVFRHYYNMSVSDYIRKRKLTLIAEKIREGMDYVVAAEMYGYKTYTGFKKAFEKEFNMSPAVYSKGIFSSVNLAEYYSEFKEYLNFCVVTLKAMKMIGHTVFPSKDADVDVAAQVTYWMGKDFPCLKNTRFSCNVEQREDKIALWYSDNETMESEYILGPVVKEFTEDVPPDMKQVTLEGGKYAIFETDKFSDEDHIVETLRMYTRCVFYGWIKEHIELVDLERLTFERYVNSKIYLYVPLK